MSDTFTTDRGTTFTKVCEGYITRFSVNDLPNLQGHFFEELLGMYRYLNKDLKLKEAADNVALKVQQSKERLARRKAEIKQMEEQAENDFQDDILEAINNVLPSIEGDPRNPKVIAQSMDDIDIDYIKKMYEGKDNQQNENVEVKNV